MTKNDSAIDIAIIMDDLSLNGIATVMLNYCSRLSSKVFNISLLINGKIYEPNVDAVKNLGIEIVNLPNKKKNIIKYYRRLASVLREGNYSIAHINGSSATMAVELSAAKAAGVKTRIAHCHNSRCSHPFLNWFLRPFVSLLATNYLACSSVAGNFIFKPGTFDLLPNAFSIRQFEFDANERQMVREACGIPADATVLVHVGRVNKVKNQLFLIDIFNELAAHNDNYWLILVGDGPLFNEMKIKVSESHFNKHVLIMGNQQDPKPFYSASDALVFPSVYEGLGITVLEAQINGLPCFVSDSVPNEAEIGGFLQRSSINSGAKHWARWIERELNQLPNVAGRKIPPKASLYDIDRCATLLAKYYKTLFYESEEGGASSVRFDGEECL